MLIVISYCRNDFAFVPILPQDGTTPLYVASEKNNVEVIKFLLASGAKVNLGRKVRYQHFAHSCFGVTSLCDAFGDHARTNYAR